MTQPHSGDKTIRLIVDFTYDAKTMHEDDQEAENWFLDEILKGDNLILADSGDIGDDIGHVKVIDLVDRDLGSTSGSSNPPKDGDTEQLRAELKRLQTAVVVEQHHAKSGELIKDVRKYRLADDLVDEILVLFQAHTKAIEREARTSELKQIYSAKPLDGYDVKQYVDRRLAELGGADAAKD